MFSSATEQDAKDYNLCFSKIEQVLTECHLKYEDLPVYEENVDDQLGYLALND